MQNRSLCLSEVVKALATLLMTISPIPDKASAQLDASKPLPEKIMKAWKDAGAEFGWLRIQSPGGLVFVPQKDGKPNDIPAFRSRVGPMDA